jgi:hypothetical protein
MSYESLRHRNDIMRGVRLRHLCLTAIVVVRAVTLTASRDESRAIGQANSLQPCRCDKCSNPKTCDCCPDQRDREPSGGHTAPKSQPPTILAPLLPPEGEQLLGTVRLAQEVIADGKRLPKGTYQLRLASSKPESVVGQTPGLERWVEFVQQGKVVGREVASIVPPGETATVQKDTPPRPGTSKVETLKGDDYVRIWFNKNGYFYLIHLPKQ